MQYFDGSGLFRLTSKVWCISNEWALQWCFGGCGGWPRLFIIKLFSKCFQVKAVFRAELELGFSTVSASYCFVRCYISGSRSGCLD